MMKHLVTPEEALQIVLSRTASLESESVAHEDAFNRTLARDVVSPLDLPPFDNSAMDGYAVVASDLTNASEASPIALHVLETTGAGTTPQHVVISGACSKIMTGAPLPEGANAIVMREETREETSADANGDAVLNGDALLNAASGASVTHLENSQAAQAQAAQAQAAQAQAAQAQAAQAEDLLFDNDSQGGNDLQERDGSQRVEEKRVWILAAARAAQNIRRAGSDVRRGECVMRAGEIVHSAQWAMLASLGQSRIEVSRQPRVAILTTGEELVEVGAELGPGQIRDSNSFALTGLVQDCGGIVTLRRHIRDDEQALRAALEECACCDAIITSGGVSMGDFDPVRDVLPTVADVHFWKIAMKPGKPVMFATMPSSNVANDSQHNATAPHRDARIFESNASERASDINKVELSAHEYSCAGKVPVFGLPGNPVSVMVAFEQFVRPALLKMQGREARHRVALRARVTTGFSSPPDRVEFVRAHVATDETQGWSARVTGDQGSGRLSTMTRANALLVIPDGVTRIESGDVLTAQMTDWPETE